MTDPAVLRVLLSSIWRHPPMACTTRRRRMNQMGERRWADGVFCPQLVPIHDFGAMMGGRAWHWNC